LNRWNILEKAVALLIIVVMILSAFVASGNTVDTSTKGLYDLSGTGNTLIVDSFNTRIIEVTSSGNIIWSYSIGLNNPADSERLNNGNTLIVDTWNNRVIEVDNTGTIVWNISTGLAVPFDAERLVSQQFSF